jgi:hypothetical protein
MIARERGHCTSVARVGWQPRTGIGMDHWDDGSLRSDEILIQPMSLYSYPL